MIERPQGDASGRAGRFYARVRACDWLNPSVVRLCLAPEGGARLQYREGQYLSIELPDGDVRAYSMACAVRDDALLELHIRLHPAGKFSTLLRDGSLENSRLRIDGPFGDCCWQAPVASGAPVLMLATGTGIAPLNALLEAALRDGCSNPITLYWGGLRPDDFYLGERFAGLSQRYPNFHCVPVLAPGHDLVGTGYGATWQGARGLVQQLASRQHADLSQAHVYACGAPAMVAAARELLIKANRLAPERFLADAFEPSKRSAPAAPASTPRIEVTVEASDRSPLALQLAVGASLMEGLRAARLIQGVCGGKQSCGTCRVRFTPEGFARLPAARRVEQRLLSALGHSGPLDRLACQLMLESALDGLVLRIPPSDG